MKIEHIKQKLRPYYVPLVERLLFRLSQQRKPLRIMSSLRTIRYIKKHGCSISRYGDGELQLMMYSTDIGFQRSSAELAQALRDVITSNHRNLLICLPACIFSTVGMKPFAANYWYNYSFRSYNHMYSMINNYGKAQYLFGDAMLTRPYMDWKSRLLATIRFSALKSLWKNRSLLIVEGEQTRLGVGNNLFQKAASIRRILAPSKNAYARYSEIRNAVIDNYQGELVLLALGPTATVLAADLASTGIQALDIGHIDIEYMWYLLKATEKVSIPQKYVNEVSQQQLSECHDEKYWEQVIINLEKQRVC